MSERKFEPWVGKHYWREGLDGVRVLILGESHHDGGGKNAEVDSKYTIAVVRKLAIDGRYAFFTKVQQLVLGIGPGHISDADRSGFWGRVAFCNYVQSIVGDGPRKRPTMAMWEEARVPLTETLSELTPHFLLVLGRELGRHLPQSLTPPPLQRCHVPHPSWPKFRVVDYHARVAGGLRAAQTFN